MNTTSFKRMVVGFALFTTILLASLPSRVARDRLSASEPVVGPRLLPDDCLPKDPPPPVVKVKVRVPAYSEPGQPIEYRICVENCSTAEAHHVVVKNALPANAKFVKSDPEPAKQGPELQWNLGTIGGGAVREIVLVLQPTNKEDVKNCVRVQFEHGVCLVTRQAAAAPPGVRPPIVTPIPGVDAPVLDLVVNGPAKQYTNLPAKYIFTLTNKGKAKAVNTIVSVRLPDKLKFDKATGDPKTVNDNDYVWGLGTLDVGASKTFELVLRAAGKGDLCFKATAKADGVPEKGWEICTNFTGVSGMSVEMIADKNVAFIGDKRTFPIVIVNQGGAPLTNIRVRALIPDALRLDKTTPPGLEKKEAVLGAEMVEFKLLPELDAGKRVTYEVSAAVVKMGVTIFQVEITADQLTSGPVWEQEMTHVVDDREKVKIKELSRKKQAAGN